MQSAPFFCGYSARRRLRRSSSRSSRDAERLKASQIARKNSAVIIAATKVNCGVAFGNIYVANSQKSTAVAGMKGRMYQAQALAAAAR